MVLTYQFDDNSMTFNNTQKLLAGTLALVLAAIMPSVYADDTTCVGFLLPGTYENVVAPGPFCAIGFGVTVTDNVKHTGGSLFISGGATVNGSVQSEGGTPLSISGSIINGNVEADGTGSVSIDSSTVTGNVQVKNIAGSVILAGNTITGDVQIEESGTTLGSFIIVGFPAGGFAGNMITGDLQLIKNAASTTFVSGNTITGAVKIEETSASLGSAIVVGAPFFGIAGNMITGDLQLIKNATDSVIVSGNTISNGNLQCKENTAGGVTALGVSNIVSNGNKEDQCSAALGF